METDAAIGQVLEAIESSGVTENTLVIFTSDNGCAPYIGVPEMEKNGHFPSGPLRGYKSDAWEGGHRVPFIVRWPGVVQAGRVSNQLVHQADLMATIADVLERELPADAGEDSFSMLPLLRGVDKPIREHAVSCASSGVPALRDGQWKYIAGPGSGGWGKGGDQSQPVQLYDLASDIDESKNLAEAEPVRLSAMQALLEQIIRRGRSRDLEGDEPSNAKNDVRVKRYPTGK